MKIPEYEFKYLSTDQIEIKPLLHFRIRENNLEFLQHGGPVLPILVYREKRKFILLDGVKRYESIVHQGEKTLPTLIWQKSLLEGIIFAIRQNHSINPFDIIEQIKIIYILNKKFGLSLGQIKAQLPDIHLPMTNRKMTFYHEIFSFPLKYQVYLKKTRASLKQITQFISFPLEIREALLSFNSVLPIKMKDALEIMFYMYVHKQKSDSNLWQQEIKLCHNRLHAENAKSIDLLKEFWFYRAFPRLKERLNQIEKIKQKFYKKGIILQFDRNLESKKIQLSTNIQKFDDFLNYLNYIKEKDVLHKIQTILQILNES